MDLTNSARDNGPPFLLLPLDPIKENGSVPKYKSKTLFFTKDSDSINYTNAPFPFYLLFWDENRKSQIQMALLWSFPLFLFLHYVANKGTSLNLHKLATPPSFSSTPKSPSRCLCSQFKIGHLDEAAQAHTDTNILGQPASSIPCRALDRAPDYIRDLPVKAPPLLFDGLRLLLFFCNERKKKQNLTKDSLSIKIWDLS